MEYYYNSTAAQGDIAPIDQADGVGFWIRSKASEVIDNVTSNETAKALSANQGKVLKGFIDAINGVLTSDDTTLDELQEIVTYIKQNKSDLQNLSIPNIAGLIDALAGKAGLNSINYFSNSQRFDYGVSIKQMSSILSLAGYLNLNSRNDDQINFANDSHILTLLLTNLTTERSFTFPDKSGTIALLSDLASLASNRPTKSIPGTDPYTAELEDKGLFLEFENPIDFIIPTGVFTAEDELACRNAAAGDVTVVEGNGMTVDVVSSQTKKVPQFGFFGIRFETASRGGLLGQLKPI